MMAMSLSVGRNKMIYPTIKATVRQGQIKFFEAVELPENSTLLITVLDADAL